MIRYNSIKQVQPEEFKTEFELHIDPKNRWVRLSLELPWDDLVMPYIKNMSQDQGAPIVDARIVVGSLYIKHKCNYSDRETIEQIKENPYMQYFLGLNVYHPEALFDPSLFVDIRKRMGREAYDDMDKIIIKKATGREASPKKNSKQNVTEIKNKGKVQFDATVADQYIKYPTDLDLVSQCREWTETIIDEIYPQTLLEKKPRTYRKVARQAYINIAKKKKRTAKQIHKGIRVQLNYVKRNLGYIDEMLDMFEQGSFPLCHNTHWYLLVLQEVYRQQRYMYDNNTHQCDDRIVSLHQPYVRPIVRGKQKTPVEFGSKINLSLSNGFARVDRFSWNNFNECVDLKSQVEAYKEIYGYYPELVQVDKIYINRENRKWLEERHIRYTGSPLGRPPKEKESAYQKKKKRKEKNERNHVEGKFGQGKNGYNLNKIRAKLSSTSESWVCGIIFTMNVINYFTKYC